MPPPLNVCASERGASSLKDKTSTGSFRRGVILAFVSAGLFAFSVPGRPCPWLAWVALAPLFSQLRQTSAVRGFLLAGLFGWLMWFTSVSWLHAPLHDMLGMSISTALLFLAAGSFLLAFPYAVAGAVICRWQRKHSSPAGAARNAAIFALAITWLTPVFHGNIAHTQYRYPIVLQSLELGGTPLLLFLMLWVNWLLADALCDLRNATIERKPLISAIAIIGLVIIYGGVRLHQFDSAMKSAARDRWFTVGAVQPNIPITVAQQRQPDANARTNDFFTAIEQATELGRKHPEVDLLAFPENPATFVFNDDAVRRQALGKLINATGKPVMLNADAIDSSASSEIAARYNVALLMDANRNLAGHYAKIERVPFVEHIPIEKILPWLRKVFPKSQRVVSGHEPVTFAVKPGIQVIPLICYEGTFSDLTRRFIRKGGNIIVNQVNDSWFLRTPASEVHLALTLFRTVEYRVPLVRVTNSGIGAHIQADGRIVPDSRTELFTRTETAFPLYVPPQRSIYAQIGNWWMLAFALLLLSPDARSSSRDIRQRN